ncbi:MAG: hypothetical protein HQ552_12500 [Desulfobacteraceae bacterium]|nr:hypothetical protein [Desulfobacteraceae bacterium]
MNPELENDPKAVLGLTVEEELIPKFYALLSQGFTAKVRVGCTIRELLHRQLGLNADYIEQRLQTIFLDGKAVDNIDTAVVKSGATLALSAALPGLAGATLRRGGAYASMRSQISHGKTLLPEHITEGELVLKFFNLVARELGPMFLEKGVWIKGKNLQGFLQKALDSFRAGCRAAELNGQPLDIDSLANIEWDQQEIFVTVKKTL